MRELDLAEMLKLSDRDFRQLVDLLSPEMLEDFLEYLETLVDTDDFTHHLSSRTFLWNLFDALGYDLYCEDDVFGEPKLYLY